MHEPGADNAPVPQPLLHYIDLKPACCAPCPLPACRRVRSRANSGDDSQLSHGTTEENGGDSANTGGSQRSKRPRRAASGGVLGAVAAEAGDWESELVSPPLKRANSLPVRGLRGGAMRNVF